MEHLPYSQIEKGTFLIATPDINMGLFFRGVILLCEHNEAGSFGLLINKKLELELPEEILKSNHPLNSRIGVRAGGPVQPNQMMLLHTSNSVKQHTLQICEGVYLGGDLQFLQESLTEENGPFIHLCFGYTGWGSGQLEREFLDGHWYLYPGNAKYLFYTSPEKLWQILLREMGGKYATLSMIPEDLSLN